MDWFRSWWSNTERVLETRRRSLSYYLSLLPMLFGLLSVPVIGLILFRTYSAVINIFVYLLCDGCLVTLLGNLQKHVLVYGLRRCGLKNPMRWIYFAGISGGLSFVACLDYLLAILCGYSLERIYHGS